MERQSYRKKIQKVFSDPVRRIYILAGVVFIVGFFLLLWFSFPLVHTWLFRDIPRGALVMKEEQPHALVCAYRRAVDGVCVKNEQETQERFVAVMIENSIDAWPVSGLSKASVVYEAPAEANIPRFLAIYPWSTEVERAGPVRSARPYFIDWAGEYGNPLYVHVGGSPEAMSELEKRRVFHVNEMSQGWYFWRADERHPPHDTYTSSRLWRRALEKYGERYDASAVLPWVFAVAPACDVSCGATGVTIRFSNPGYSVDWVYSSSTNQYERFQVDEATPQVDDGGSPIVADTVIVERVHGTVIDAIGRLRLDTVGEGDAFVFQGGQGMNARWKKGDAASRTMWFDEQGAPLPINPGKIWIEVITEDGKITFHSSPS